MIPNASSSLTKNKDDLYETNILKELRLPEIQKRIEEVETLYTEVVKKFEFFINCLYEADTIYKLNNPNFFRNKRFARFHNKLNESQPKIDTLCQKAFAAFNSTAELHIANALITEIREEVSKRVYAENAPNFRAQREGYIRRGMLPERPALTLQEIEKFKEIEKSKDENKKHLYLICIILRIKDCEGKADIQNLFQKIDKRTDQLLKLFDMSEAQLAKAFDALPKDFTKEYRERIRQIVVIR